MLDQFFKAIRMFSITNKHSLQFSKISYRASLDLFFRFTSMLIRSWPFCSWNRTGNAFGMGRNKYGFDFELSVLGPKRKTLESIVRPLGFCKELHFYCSDRVDGADFITDCVVESELTLQELSSFDYSDSMVRFFVKRYLTDIGVNGRFMKYYKNGNPKFRKPRVTHVRRVVIERDNNIYRDTENVKFKNLSIEDIIEESP